MGGEGGGLGWGGRWGGKGGANGGVGGLGGGNGEGDARHGGDGVGTTGGCEGGGGDRGGEGASGGDGGDDGGDGGNGGERSSQSGLTASTPQALGRSGKGHVHARPPVRTGQNESPDNCDGSVPLNWLPPTSRPLSFLSAPSSVGIAPLNAAPFKFRPSSRSVHRPSCVGNVPLS